MGCDNDDEQVAPAPHQMEDASFYRQVDMVRSLYHQLFGQSEPARPVAATARPSLLPAASPVAQPSNWIMEPRPFNPPHSWLRLIERIEYCTYVRVDKDERIRILRIIRDQCSPQRQKGKRFKDAHDYTLVYEDIFVPKLITYAYKQSKPACVLCNRTIQVGEPRCKYSIANALNLSNNCERCGTHVYCLPCFVVLESTVIPGKRCVCFGTVLSQRGGCRQVSPGPGI